MILINALLYLNLILFIVIIITIIIARLRDIGGLTFGKYYKNFINTIDEDSPIFWLPVFFVITDGLLLMGLFAIKNLVLSQLLLISLVVIIFMILCFWGIIVSISSIPFLFCSKTFIQTQYLREVIDNQDSDFYKLISKYENSIFTGRNDFRIGTQIRSYLKEENCLDSILEQLILIEELSPISLDMDYNEKIGSYLESIQNLIKKANSIKANNEKVRKEDVSKFFDEAYGEKFKELTKTNSNFIKYLDSNKQ